MVSRKVFTSRDLNRIPDCWSWIILEQDILLSCFRNVLDVCDTKIKPLIHVVRWADYLHPLAYRTCACRNRCSIIFTPLRKTGPTHQICIDICRWSAVNHCQAKRLKYVSPSHGTRWLLWIGSLRKMINNPVWKIASVPITNYYKVWYICVESKLDGIRYQGW